MSKREEASDGAFESGAHIARARGPLFAEKYWFKLKRTILACCVVCAEAVRGWGCCLLAYATSEDERCAARFRRDEARAGRFQSRQGEARAERRRTHGDMVTRQRQREGWRHGHVIA